MKKLNFSFRVFGWSFLGTSIASLVCFVISLISQKPLSIADTLFLGGLLCLLYALVKIVGNLGLFDLTSFSFKKFFQSFKSKKNINEENKIGTYPEYLAKKKKKGNIWELVAVFSLFIVASAVIVLFTA